MALFNLFADKKKPNPNNGERDAVLRVLRSTHKGEKTPIINAVINAARETGVSPEMLGASAIQEGMGLKYINKPDEYSGAYSTAKWAKVIPDEYPIDGFGGFGLDTFADKYQDLRKAGYLKQDIDFVPFGAKNEKGEYVNTAAFRTTEDALRAKGAFLRSIQDQIDNKAKDMKMVLDKDTRDYLTMAAYNGGMGNANIMMKELASGNFRQSEFVSRGLTSRQGVHKNITPRLMKMKWVSEEVNRIPQKGIPPTNPMGRYDITQ